MPAILIMMLLRMGPWAEKSKPADTAYTYSPFKSQPEKWYQTWKAAIGFTFLLLIFIHLFILALCMVTGYLLHCK